MLVKGATGHYQNKCWSSEAFTGDKFHSESARANILYKELGMYAFEINGTSLSDQWLNVSWHKFWAISQPENVSLLCGGQQDEWMLESGTGMTSKILGLNLTLFQKTTDTTAVSPQTDNWMNAKSDKSNFFHKMCEMCKCNHKSSQSFKYDNHQWLTVSKEAGHI